MSGVKRVLKAVVTGGASEIVYKQEKEMRRQQEEAERQAKLQAELEAAQQAAQVIPQAESKGVEATAVDTASKKKKTLKGGKQSLSVYRSSGSGINI
ncbi:host specificity protein B [Vibrio phage 4141]|uniref:Host specificity protein B n=1 Tax=Vibrio phage 4141 TaxID=3075081 RepID=A0AAX4CYU9_9CAUD